MTDFNFSDYLKENGFAFTNHGEHNLHELEKDDQNYAVNILGDKFNSHTSLEPEVKAGQKHPKDLKEADKWLAGFLPKDKK